MNITVTQKAAGFMRRMIRFNGNSAAAGFRLMVSPGGCSGFSSSFTVETEPLAGDAVLESNGVKIFLPAESRILLEGVTVDFNDSPMSTGLTFENPNAQSCGCSSSTAGSASGVATVSVASIQRKH